MKTQNGPNQKVSRISRGRGFQDNCQESDDIQVVNWTIIGSVGMVATTVCFITLSLALVALGRGPAESSRSASHLGTDLQEPIDGLIRVSNKATSAIENKQRLEADRASPLSTEKQRSIEDVLASVVMINVGGGSGSGFLFAEPHYVVTNFHVIAGAEKASVVYSDGEEVAVKGFLYASTQHDLAILAVASTGQPRPVLPPRFKSSMRGDEVTALGAPLGLSGSVAKGTHSATRTWEEICHALPGLESEALAPNSIWLQTDTPISPGNSGGPLLDSEGCVLGVNTCSLTRGQNLNFALDIKHVLDALAGNSLAINQLSSLPRMPRVVRKKLEEDVDLAVVDATRSYWQSLDAILKNWRDRRSDAEARAQRTKRIRAAKESVSTGNRVWWPLAYDEVMAEYFEDCGREVGKLSRLRVVRPLASYGRILQTAMSRQASAYRQIMAIRPAILDAKIDYRPKTPGGLLERTIVSEAQMTFTPSQLRQLDLLRDQIFHGNQTIERLLGYEFELMRDTLSETLRAGF